MPEASPTSAIAHWRRLRCAMLMTQMLRQRNRPIVVGKGQISAGDERPDAGDAGRGR